MIPAELGGEERRLRMRRRLILFSLPILVLAVVAGLKLILMVGLTGAAAGAYDRGDFGGAVTLSRWQTVLNVVEPWKAHFNVGDGLAGQKLLPDAQAEFERALELASPKEQCPVRVNLYLVLEVQGDAAFTAGDSAGASTLYGDALTVIGEADASCLQPPPKGADGTDQELQDGKQRLEEKQKAAQGGTTPQSGDPGDQSGDAPTPTTPDDSTIQDLENRLKDADKARSDQDSADRSHDSGSPYTDTPW
jgi:hypothetical protein